MTKCPSVGLISQEGIVLEVLWCAQMELFKLKPCCHVLFKMKRLSSATLPSKSYSISVFLTVLSCNLTFNIPTDVCRVRNLALVFFGFQIL